MKKKVLVFWKSDYSNNPNNKNNVGSRWRPGPKKFTNNHLWIWVIPPNQQIYSNNQVEAKHNLLGEGKTVYKVVVYKYVSK